MIYDWHCKKCDKEIEITTMKFDHSDITPDEIDEEEIVMARTTVEGKEDCQHVWEKYLGGFRLSRGASWSGRKGNW